MASPRMLSKHRFGLPLSGLSNGGLVELTMMLVETLLGSTSQIAFGACDFTSFRSGIDTSE